MAALDKHETRGADNLLSIISAEKPGFSLWEILERIPDIFFFLPPRTNKNSGISRRSLRGNDMVVGVLGAIIQRFNDPQVGSNRSGKQKRVWDLARKR